MRCEEVVFINKGRVGAETESSKAWKVEISLLKLTFNLEWAA